MAGAAVGVEDGWHVRVVSTGAELAAAYRVREIVFVQGQGVPAAIEQDDLDDDADHLVAVVAGVVVATGRLVVRGEVGVVGRLAVLQEYRGSGLGTAVLFGLERRARERGLSVLELHAQAQAHAFYDRRGFTAYGGEYEEAGIRHVSMSKRLLAATRHAEGGQVGGDVGGAC